MPRSWSCPAFPCTLLIAALVAVPPGCVTSRPAAGPDGPAGARDGTSGAWDEDPEAAGAGSAAGRDTGAQGAPHALPRGIDPRVTAILDARREGQPQTPRIRFQVLDSYALPDEHGRMIVYSHNLSGSLEHPERMALTVEGDLHDIGLWKDGSQVTLLDRRENTWRVEEGVETPGAVMDLLTPSGAPRLPLGYFLEPDPIAAMLEGVLSAEVLGTSRINEVLCDHLILSTAESDLQLWIERDGKRRIQHLVESWRTLPGHPRFELTMQISTAVDRFPESTFVFTPPEGSRQVDSPAAGDP